MKNLLLCILFLLISCNLSYAGSGCSIDPNVTKITLYDKSELLRVSWSVLTDP